MSMSVEMTKRRNKMPNEKREMEAIKKDFTKVVKAIRNDYGMNLEQYGCTARGLKASMTTNAMKKRQGMINCYEDMELLENLLNNPRLIEFCKANGGVMFREQGSYDEWHIRFQF